MTEDQQATDHQGHAGPPSAATAAAQVLNRLADLARTSLQTEATLAKQTVDLTWATIVGDLDRTSANKAYVESVTRESARYWRTVGELGLDYASDLVTLGKSVSTAVLREVAAAGRKPGTRQTTGRSAGSEESTPHHVTPQNRGAQSASSRTRHEPSAGAVNAEGGGRRVSVHLTGSLGERAEGTITVANQHPRARRIQLSTGDLADSRGAAVGAALEVTPTTVTVASGKERSVKLGVDLDGAHFLAGKRYFGTVEVSGGDEATIDVSVEVSP
jgi:hypothetical protein